MFSEPRENSIFSASGNVFPAAGMSYLLNVLREKLDEQRKTLGFFLAVPKLFRLATRKEYRVPFADFQEFCRYNDGC